MTEYKGQTALELYDVGYRQISRRWCIVARVDMSNEEMVEMFVTKNFGDRDSGLPSLSIESQKDHYRRCYSKDKMAVPERIMKELRAIVSEPSRFGRTIDY